MFGEYKLVELLPATPNLALLFVCPRQAVGSAQPPLSAPAPFQGLLTCIFFELGFPKPNLVFFSWLQPRLKNWAAVEKFKPNCHDIGMWHPGSGEIYVQFNMGAWRVDVKNLHVFGIKWTDACASNSNSTLNRKSWIFIRTLRI